MSNKPSSETKVIKYSPELHYNNHHNIQTPQRLGVQNRREENIRNKSKGCFKGGSFFSDQPGIRIYKYSSWRRGSYIQKIVTISLLTLLQQSLFYSLTLDGCFEIMCLVVVVVWVLKWWFTDDKALLEPSPSPRPCQFYCHRQFLYMTESSGGDSFSQGYLSHQSWSQTSHNIEAHQASEEWKVHHLWSW